MRDEKRLTEPSVLADETVLMWLEAASEQLHDQARMLVDDYWRQLKSRPKKLNSTAQGRIGVRIRRRENSFSFSIEWYRMSTIRQNDQNKPICLYLKKGLGYRYPLQRFLKNEPEWEVSLVEELETEFADIRKQMALLAKVRDAYQNFRKASQAPRSA